jgi:hypothetical protein
VSLFKVITLVIDWSALLFKVDASTVNAIAPQVKVVTPFSIVIAPLFRVIALKLRNVKGWLKSGHRPHERTV